MTVEQQKHILTKTKKVARNAADFVWRGLFNSKIKQEIEPGKAEEIRKMPLESYYPVKPTIM